MPKIILYIATSLDGYIAKEDGNIDWLFHDEDYGYSKFLSTIDTIIFGRKTYEQVLTFGEWPYSEFKTLVFTHQNLKQKNNVKFISGSITQAITKIKKQSTKNIWLVGGGNIITEFAKIKLIDEYRLFIHPIFLGAGIPIMQQTININHLKFTKTKSYKSGLIELHLEQETKQ
jgi:dihydrofolate reductase